MTEYVQRLQLPQPARLPPADTCGFSFTASLQSCHDQAFSREADEEINYHEYQAAIMRSIASLEVLLEHPLLAPLNPKPEKVNWKKEGF